MYLEDHRVTPCIDATLACYRACLGMVSTREHGLDGPLAEFLRQCAVTCREMADQLIVGRSHLTVELLNCATVSDHCADACEKTGGMQECAAVCRWCAAACRKLSELEAKSD